MEQLLSGQFRLLQLFLEGIAIEFELLFGLHKQLLTRICCLFQPSFFCSSFSRLRQSSSDTVCSRSLAFLKYRSATLLRMVLSCSVSSQSCRIGYSSFKSYFVRRSSLVSLMMRSRRDLRTFSNLFSVISLSFIQLSNQPRTNTFSYPPNTLFQILRLDRHEKSLSTFPQLPLRPNYEIVITMKQVTLRNPKRATINVWSKHQLIPGANETKRQGGQLPALRLNRIQSRDHTELRKRKHEHSLINGKRRLSMVDDYELKHKIGEGAFAEVYVAVDTRNNEKVVIKTYDKLKLFDKQRKLNIKNQITILSRIDHPRIIKLIEVIDNARHINLVMEYFSENSLRKCLNERETLSEGEIKTVIKQIAEALSFLHKEGLAHRDIKMENILVDEELNIKIIDFGFAVESRETAQASIVGTPSYISPELIAGKHYNPFKADVWAFGVLLYYMATGYFPFRGDSKNLYKIISKGEVMFPHDINPGCQYLIRKMLNTQYEQRIKADEILKDTWIKPVNFKQQINLLEKAIKHNAH